jgi:transketolase
MEITGEIIAILPLVEGQGKNGQWFKQEYILEVPGQYPKKVCFSLWGNKIDEYNLKVRQNVTAHVDVESREYNSRWYTEVKAWKVDKNSTDTRAASQPASAGQRALDPVPEQLAGDGSDDLPF